jgi:hypothetical protein
MNQAYVSGGNNDQELCVFGIAKPKQFGTLLCLFPLATAMAVL